MTFPCLLMEGTPEEQTRLERLRESLELGAVSMDGVSKEAQRGILIILLGTILKRVERNSLESALRRQADVMLMPPFAHDDLAPLLPTEGEMRLEPIPLSVCRVVDDELREAMGQDEVTIFYQKGIRSNQGRSLIQSASGRSVLVNIQPRSSWGRILTTTFLLTSLSARSKQSDINAFWSGLLRWLDATSPPVVQPIGASQPSHLDSDYGLSIALMAIHLCQQNGIVTKEKLEPAVQQIQAKLSRGSSDLRLQEALAQLQATGVLVSQGEIQWEVNFQRLTEAIGRAHLGSYLRRLQ